MKALLKSLFGRRENTGNTVTISAPATLESSANNLVSEENLPKENSFGGLKKFLEKDHYADGLSQGYIFHSESGMQLYLNDLKSRFRMEINALDELIHDVILSKKKKIIDLGGMMPNLKEQLNLEIASDEEMRQDLKLQKELSVDGEGWVAQVLYAFEKGYRKGMLDYLNIREFSTRGIL